MPIELLYAKTTNHNNIITIAGFFTFLPQNAHLVLSPYRAEVFARSFLSKAIYIFIYMNTAKTFANTIDLHGHRATSILPVQKALIVSSVCIRGPLNKDPVFRNLVSPAFLWLNHQTGDTYTQGIARIPKNCLTILKGLTHTLIHSCRNMMLCTN